MPDTQLLQMALIGYEAERQKIQTKIAELQAQLNGSPHRANAPVAVAPVKRTRRQISAAVLAASPCTEGSVGGVPEEEGSLSCWMDRCTYEEIPKPAAHSRRL